MDQWEGCKLCMLDSMFQQRVLEIVNSLFRDLSKKCNFDIMR